MKNHSVLVAALLAATFLGGPIAFSQTEAPLQRAPEIQALADRAGALPVEFRADVLLRLIAAGKIADSKWQREILEDLFTAAAQAHYPLAMFDVGTQTDTRSWALASGFKLGLDTLSIRCRVVSTMLAVDPRRARELFVQTAPAQIADPKCEDELAPNVSLWFETLRDVADRSFPGAERGQGFAIQFFEPYLRAMESSLQLPSAARAIRTLKASGEQRQKLVNVFAAKMADLADGDRAFTFAIRRLDLPGEIVQLGEESRKQGVSVDNLLAAYRSFLVTHVSAGRCADSALKEDAVRKFNERLRWAGYLASADLDAIPDAEGRPSKAGGKANMVPYWQSAPAKRLLSAIKHLRFGDGSRALSDEQKRTVEWQNEVRQFLADLANWSPQDEPSAADYFHERAILYTGLMDLIPDGPLRDSVVQSCVAFMSQNPIEMESPIQFLPHLNAIFQMANRPEATLFNSKDPVISLYLAVTRVSGR